MADNQLTSQIIAEVEEQHVGSQRASQIIAEVEWQWPYPEVTGLLVESTDEDIITGGGTIIITLSGDTWISA